MTPSFSIPNARVTRVHARELVSYLTLLAASDRQGMTIYFDVVCFATNGLAIPAEGASVSVTGTLGRRKPQTGTAWTTELVARAIEAGDEGVTPVQRGRAAGGATADAGGTAADLKASGVREEDGTLYAGDDVPF